MDSAPTYFNGINVHWEPVLTKVSYFCGSDVPMNPYSPKTTVSLSLCLVRGRAPLGLVFLSLGICLGGSFKGDWTCHHHHNLAVWLWATGAASLFVELPLWVLLSCNSSDRATIDFPSPFLMFSLQSHRENHSSACAVCLLSPSGGCLPLVPKPLICTAEIWRRSSLISLSFLWFFILPLVSADMFPQLRFCHVLGHAQTLQMLRASSPY